MLGTIAFVRLRRSLDTAPDAVALCAPLAAEDLLAPAPGAATSA